MFERAIKLDACFVCWALWKSCCAPGATMSHARTSGRCVLSVCVLHKQGAHMELGVSVGLSNVQSRFCAFGVCHNYLKPLARHTCPNKVINPLSCRIAECSKQTPFSCRARTLLQWLIQQILNEIKHWSAFNNKVFLNWNTSARGIRGFVLLLFLAEEFKLR